MVIQSCRDLEIYKLSFDLAMQVFRMTRTFPREEQYAMVDQIRRSSRSVTANISEGFAKRKYKDVFIRHLNDALGSSEETVTWIEFAHKCRYVTVDQAIGLQEEYRKMGAMIYKLMKNWRNFN